MVTYNVYAAIRDNHQMRDADVARTAGVTPSTFSDWKSGRSTPKLDKLRKIAAVLGVAVDDLIEEAS